MASSVSEARLIRSCFVYARERSRDVSVSRRLIGLGLFGSDRGEPSSLWVSRSSSASSKSRGSGSSADGTRRPINWGGRSIAGFQSLSVWCAKDRTSGGRSTKHRLVRHPSQTWVKAILHGAKDRRSFHRLSVEPPPSFTEAIPLRPAMLSLSLTFTF